MSGRSEESILIAGGSAVALAVSPLPLIGLDFERSSPRETGNCMSFRLLVELWRCCATKVFAVLLCERDQADGKLERPFEGHGENAGSAETSIVFSRLADESLGEGAESGWFRRADDAFPSRRRSCESPSSPGSRWECDFGARHRPRSDS